MSSLPQTAPLHSRKSVSRTNWVSGYGMLIPAFFLMLLFSYFPPIVAIILSFFNWDGFSSPSFAGLSNYISVLRNHIFWLSMLHMLVWSVIKLVFEILVPMIVAVMIFHLRSKRLQYIYRILFVIPMVVPMVVQLMIWTFIYDSNVGMLNTILSGLGLRSLELNWLGGPHVALISLAFVGFPFVVPLNLLIFYSGMQGIPESVFDAAKLEGVQGVKRLIKIEFPLLLGQLKLLMILTVIGLLQNIMMPLVMTNGGPGYATYVPGLYMYFTAFQDGQFGTALAIAMIIFIIVMALTLVQVKFIKPSTEFEA